MTGAYCDHCDLPMDQCIHGRPQPKTLLPATGPTIDANIAAPCAADCGRKIQPSQSITYTSEGWAHTGCTTPTAHLFEGI